MSTRIASEPLDVDQDLFDIGELTPRPCAWCRGPIPASARSDAVCCSKRCRQARHRAERADLYASRRRPRTTPLLGLTIRPTIAMRMGRQVVEQCAWCGTVVVLASPAPRESLGPCPGCDSSSWWGQALPVAGLEASDA